MEPSNELIEWDYTHALALQRRVSQYDEPDGLGTPRHPDARTRWLRVFVEYPDDYLTEYPELLGPAVYEVNPDQQSLVKYFPQADFSIEEVRNAVLDRLDEVQFSHLVQTDFYVTRLAETGEPIPEDIARKRTEVRDTLTRLKAKAKKAKPEDLASFRDEIDALPHPERPQRRKQFRTGHDHDAADAPGAPGDRPSSLRPGEEPTPFDESLTEPPDPALEGAPAPWVPPHVPPGDGN